MGKLQFDDELSRVVEAFNASAGARSPRARIKDVMKIDSGFRVLDVGCGPGNQAFELSGAVGDAGLVCGVDVSEGAIDIARQRCAVLNNVQFQIGDATKLPYGENEFDVVMSSQVFEYLEDVDGAIMEIHSVLKPGGRILIHYTDWGGLLWYSSDPKRMKKILQV